MHLLVGGRVAGVRYDAYRDYYDSYYTGNRNAFGRQYERDMSCQLCHTATPIRVAGR